MHFICISSAIFLTLIQISRGESGMEVKTPYGIYKGHLIQSRGGRDILAFKGIPYAQPPVGKLRFKDPVKLMESDDVIEANQEIECLQVGVTISVTDKNPNDSKFIGREDCLYLNIYRPKEIPLTKQLPVYFWIHGGAFFAGSGSEAWNGPRFLLDEKRDIVMVTINYRLGVLGFLSANDDNLPGNLGLKDQTMALKWVQENIKFFGGDPNSVTIGGVSAGGASVSHHLNSKLSKGLFHRAISQSGTADCSWARKSIKEARKIASNIIAQLGCPFQPDELMECLEGLPAEAILTSEGVLKVEKTAMVMYLVPVIEKDSPTAFMTEESIAEGSTVPWLTGVTSEESLVFYQLLAMQDPGYIDMSLIKKKYKELLPVLGYYTASSNANKITNELKKFYFGNKEIEQNSAKDFVQLLSDRLFNYGLHLSSKKHKGNLFMYKLSYRGKPSMAVIRPEGLEDGVSHGDDIMYFFNCQFANSPMLKDDADLDFSNTLIEMWYSFIKTGDPTPDTHIWEESEGGIKYLDFTNQGPVMSSDLFKNRMEFLDSLDNKLEIHEEL